MPSETTPGDGERENTKKKVTMNVNNTQTTTAQGGDGRRGAPGGGEWRHSGRVQGADFMCVCCENEWEVNAGSAGSFSVCVYVSVWLLAVAKATKQK